MTTKPRATHAAVAPHPFSSSGAGQGAQDDSPPDRSAWSPPQASRSGPPPARGRGRTGAAPRLAALAAALLLAGCASYRALPLARHPHLADGLAGLAARLPSPEPALDLAPPLRLDTIGVLAVLNDPDLRAAWGQVRVAQAGLLQASLLPNPSVGLGFAALLGGPGTTPAYTASLSQDVAALVTYHARVSAAQSHLAQVNAALLWQQWQVAQKARLLALDIYWTGRSIALTQRELHLLADELAQLRSAAAAGNVALAALAPLLAARASAEQTLVALDLGRLRHWQALDALLGLMPAVRFAIARPRLPPLPPDLDALTARLARTRPDLVALRLGYRSAEASLRAAILGQFPALVLGGTWSSDTTDVRSAGPNVTFDLPVFNRNQGGIGLARATRRMLHAQYAARLDAADGTVRGLAAQIRRLSTDLERARDEARSAARIARTARAAYAQNNLDQRSLTDYETTALQRELEVADLQRMLGEDRITLGVALGAGLPMTRLAPSGAETRS